MPGVQTYAIMDDARAGCLICGEDLVYSGTESEAVCWICGKRFKTNVKCVNGHFICDNCHSSGVTDAITAFCMKTDLKDPLEIAVSLMHHQRMHMHGPEHHYLVPAALITAYCNATGRNDGKEDMLKKALSRSGQVKGGFCGSHGTCGAATGTGIFMSIITGSTPLSRRSWSLSNMMTGTALIAIAEAGGPRCCKRDTYIAILTAVKFLEENCGIRLPTGGKITCEFSGLNRECLKEACRFWPGQSDNLK